MISVFLIVASLTGNLREAYTAVETDPERIAVVTEVSGRGRANSCDTFEMYLKVPVSDEELSQLAALQAPDGCWSDIDYSDQKRNGWDPLQHALRVARLSIRFARTGDREALRVARRAILWWGSNRPECRNWWYNEIGVPRQFCAAAVLLGDVLSEDERAALKYILGRSSFKQTGQNKVWQAGNVLVRGLLEDDEMLVWQARDVIVSELRVSDDAEGLQKDWSFHQHGAQLQFGNYGLSFAVSQSWWARAFEGTPLQLDAFQRRLLEDYVREGLARVVWNGWFDMSACGRQVFKNDQRSKALSVEYVCRNIGLDGRSLKGASYYPMSDFGVYRADGWYASIRMQSPRIVPYETTNRENMMGWFSSDGAMLLRTDGDEYDSISAVWNWRHIPGVTSWDDGTRPWGPASKKERNLMLNRSENVGGRVEGDVLLAWMEYDRGGIKAKKAWIFFPEGVVCLGAGISFEPEKVSQGTVSVVTTLEQNRLRGEVSQGTIARRGGVGGRCWVRHRGTTYVSLDGQKIVVGSSVHRGSWGDIAPFYDPDDFEEAAVFEAWIDHGARPSDASYSYAVIPPGRKSALKVAGQISVLSNTPSQMKVRIGSRTFTL